MAGTILRFPAKDTASNRPTDRRRAKSACVVLRLPAVSRAPLAVAGVIDRAAPAQDADSILVALLRESVARGEYRVDAGRVARKLIAADGL